MSPVAERLLFGVVASTVVAAVAVRWRALDRSGGVGAVLVGTLVLGFGGWAWAATLVTFFVTSSGLSSLGSRRTSPAVGEFAKGARRDVGQVLANGGIASLLALAAWWLRAPELFVPFAGAVAAATADTWATEVGVLSRRPPRLITTWRRVPRGMSGAVSPLGSAASAAGAALIAAVSVCSCLLPDHPAGRLPASSGAWWELALAVSIGGVAGALLDSVLGATVQRMHWSAARNVLTEQPRDPDGAVNRVVRGVPWLDNDLVNVLCTAAGALVSAAVWAAWP